MFALAQISAIHFTGICTSSRNPSTSSLETVTLKVERQVLCHGVTQQISFFFYILRRRVRCRGQGGRPFIEHTSDCQAFARNFGSDNSPKLSEIRLIVCGCRCGVRRFVRMFSTCFSLSCTLNDYKSMDASIRLRGHSPTSANFDSTVAAFKRNMLSLIHVSVSNTSRNGSSAFKKSSWC